MSLEYESTALAELAAQSIPDCFETAVRRFKDEPALSHYDLQFSYEDLNHLANRLAHAILQRTAPGRQPIVLMMEQHVWTVVGLLAILKAGKICVPVNPVNNEARALDTILREVKPQILITTSDHIELAQRLAGNTPVLNVESFGGGDDTNPDIVSAADDLAFVIYTSGSTGIPKGVLHNHRNILHRIFWYAARFEVNASDSTMLLSSADHMSGIVGMLRTLITGGRLHMFSIRHEGLAELARSLVKQRITILPIVNSLFRRFIDELPDDAQFPSVRLIFTFGEATNMGDVERYRRHFSDDCVLVNTLGCTELPTYRYFVIDKHTLLPDDIVPAGHAMPGIETIIVDGDGEKVVDGQSGEIIVRSRYLALGYWNRPQETAEKFSTHDDGTRIYRTGDLGRMRADGVLEHTGRKDWMVKILGNRVEVVEIENILRLHPDVRDTAVSVWQDVANEAQLCAYVVPRKNLLPSVQNLKAFLRERLPDYMVPLAFEFPDALPLNRTGKLDRRALKSPGFTRDQNERVIDAARTDTERCIAKICRDVLRLNEIGVHENLFDLGANSLIAMQIVNRLRQEFALELSPTLPFYSPTVFMLASVVESALLDSHES